MADPQTVDPFAALGAKPVAWPPPSADEFSSIGAKPAAAGRGSQYSPEADFHQTAMTLAEDVKKLGIGALKGTGRTALNVVKLLSYLTGDHPYVAPAADALQQKIGAPEGVSQNLGALAADMLVGGVAGKGIGMASDLAEGVIGGGRVVGAVTRGVVQGVGNAATAAAQGGNPVVGGVVGAAGGVTQPLKASVEERLRSGANESMIRALGPAGGKGPSAAANLRKAEDIAPDLVAQSFRPLTQAAARDQAAATLKTAKATINTVLSGPEGQASFDDAKLLYDLDSKRAALRIIPNKANPSFSVLPPTSRAEDALYEALQNDIRALGPKPSVEAIHKIKQQWNNLADFAAENPAAGTDKDVFEKGGDLIRAQLASDHAAVSAADQRFSFASKLNQIVNATTVRRPSAGIAAAVSPYAAKGIGTIAGGAEGYREGGVPGAMAGAAVGYNVAKLLQSPGFRYVSSSVKKQLADALDKGNPAVITALVSVASAQAARNEKQP